MKSMQMRNSQPMQNYKVMVSKLSSGEEPCMEFTAKDDLAASEIAEKFAKMHRAFVYVVYRKARKHWLKQYEDTL